MWRRAVAGGASRRHVRPWTCAGIARACVCWFLLAAAPGGLSRAGRSRGARHRDMRRCRAIEDSGGDRGSESIRFGELGRCSDLRPSRRVRLSPQGCGQSGNPSTGPPYCIGRPSGSVAVSQSRLHRGVVALAAPWVQIPSRTALAMSCPREGSRSAAYPPARGPGARAPAGRHRWWRNLWRASRACGRGAA
jgi:hypothetical protein